MARTRPQHIRIMMTVNGRALAIVPARSAASPPATSSAMAVAPTSSAQKLCWTCPHPGCSGRMLGPSTKPWEIQNRCNWLRMVFMEPAAAQSTQPHFSQMPGKQADSGCLQLASEWMVGPPGLEPGTKGFALPGCFHPERTISSPSALAGGVRDALACHQGHCSPQVVSAPSGGVPPAWLRIAAGQPAAAAAVSLNSSRSRPVIPGRRHLSMSPLL